MNREQDFYPQEELQNDLKALDDAIKANTVFDLFETSDKVIDPDVLFVAKDFELSEDRFYHGLITSCFTSIPSGTVEENAKEFIGRFKYMQEMMVKSFRSTEDLNEIIESVIIKALDLEGASDFASFYNTDSEINYLSMPENHELYKIQEKASEYWNKMDEIIFCAYEIEKSSKDPDLDQTLKQ